MNWQEYPAEDRQQFMLNVAHGWIILRTNLRQKHTSCRVAAVKPSLEAGVNSVIRSFGILQKLGFHGNLAEADIPEPILEEIAQCYLGLSMARKVRNFIPKYEECFFDLLEIEVIEALLYEIVFVRYKKHFGPDTLSTAFKGYFNESSRIRDIDPYTMEHLLTGSEC